jgi:hypothetical protein
MYSAPNENEIPLHSQLFDGHETISNLRGAFEIVRQHMIIYVRSLFGLSGECFEHLS